VSAASARRDVGSAPRGRWVVQTLRSWGTVAFLGVLPVLLIIGLIGIVLLNGRQGSDFATFWNSGRAVLHGLSPYPDMASLPRVADRETSFLFVYPPPAAFLMVPFSLLPFPAANALFLLLNLGCVALALRLLGVRDWRCFGAAFLSVPVFSAVAIGTLSSLLLLGVATAWRYRQRRLVLGVVIAVVIVMKLFLWPLLFWLIAARHRAAAVLAGASIVATTLLAWWAIGFAGFHDYPRRLGRFTELFGGNSYSLYALLRAAGVSSRAAQIGLVLLASLLLIAAVITFGRLGDERRLFVAALGIALLTTPIMWPHYLVLLLVPVALRSRTFSIIWLLPLLLWLDSAAWSHGQATRIIPVLLGTVGILLIALQGRALTKQPAATEWLSRRESLA
jgi:alpha-1,2-mannosyltransferase